MFNLFMNVREKRWDSNGWIYTKMLFQNNKVFLEMVRSRGMVDLSKRQGDSNLDFFYPKEKAK